MPDDEPQTPVEQKALNGEQRTDYRNARLRDQFGEWFKLFQPDAPTRKPVQEPEHDQGLER